MMFWSLTRKLVTEVKKGLNKEGKAAQLVTELVYVTELVSELP